MDLVTDAETDEPENNSSAKADEAALDLMKQIITLASGVLALSATFIDKIGPRPKYLLIILAVSWFALIISVLFGLQTMSTIVKSRINADMEWSTGKGKNCARISKYGFVCGIALFALFAFLLLAGLTSASQGSPTFFLL